MSAPAPHPPADDPELPDLDDHGPLGSRPVRYGSRMLRQFGWFYHLLGMGMALARLRFEDHSAERIRRAAKRGPVVYVMLRRSVIDYLAVNTVLNRQELPLAEWVNGVRTFPWQPVVPAWRDVFTRLRALFSRGRAPHPVRSGWLAGTVARGTTTAVFLRDTVGRPADDDEDPLAAILAAQERSDRPIQLVPVLTVWDRAPEVDHASRSFLLGSREDPGLITRLVSVWFPEGKGPFVQAGEPLDLAEFIRRVPEPSRRRSHLRRLLRRYLKREGKVVRGPRLLPRQVIKQLVLDNPPMRTFAEEEATRTGTTEVKVRRRMSKEFDRIAANFSFTLIRACSILMRPLWTRVYSGYDIRDEDLDRIRQATRDGTAVLVPCHKSHFDYLLMSWVLYYADLIVPHVVAGVNLAIWPVDTFLRAAGGFFIERSFADSRIHPTVFSRYLRELLRQGYTVEFFIEGGRTRSGKLLRPKLGVLKMVLDAAAKSRAGHEITLLPVSIAYEQVAEEKAYRSELRGSEKQKESVGQLIKARRVLRRRFGRVYLRVGDPIKASTVVPDEPTWDGLGDDARHELARVVGERIIHRIGQSMVALPTALVALSLLAHHRQGLTHATLQARADRFRTFLARHGAMEAASLEHFEQALTQALARFERDRMVRSLASPQGRVWQIVPEQRVLLDFHKNQLLHFFAPAALTAAALRGTGRDRFTLDDVGPSFAFLCATLHREFTFDPDLDPEGRLRQGLDDLVAHGALAVDGDGWRVADAERMGEIHGLIRGLIESYLLVARAARRHAGQPIERKAFVRDLQDHRDAALTAGDITRPEALSAVNLKNALSAYRDAGALHRAGELLAADVPALDELIEVLDPMTGG